jgi:hypothetical protein
MTPVGLGSNRSEVFWALLKLKKTLTKMRATWLKDKQGGSSARRKKTGF